MRSSPRLRLSVRSAQRQRGHALTEFIVLAVALVPLFLLMPLIGKYQDISHSVLAASRYAAFDILTRYNDPKPQAQLEKEIHRRFFSSSESPIKSSDRAQDVTIDQNPLWRDPANKPLIAKFSDIRVDTVWTPQSSSPKVFNDTAQITFGLPQHELYTATITVPLVNLPEGLRFYEPFDKLNLLMSRHTTVVPDSWSGSSASQVQGQIDRALLVPLSRPLKALSPYVDLTMKVVEPGVRPPKLGELQFWADQVPLDRLK